MLTLQDLQQGINKLELANESDTRTGEKSLSMRVDFTTGKITYIVDAAMRRGALKRATVDNAEYDSVEEALECYNKIYI